MTLDIPSHGAPLPPLDPRERGESSTTHLTSRPYPGRVTNGAVN